MAGQLANAVTYVLGSDEEREDFSNYSAKDQLRYCLSNVDLFSLQTNIDEGVFWQGSQSSLFTSLLPFWKKLDLS